MSADTRLTGLPSVDLLLWTTPGLHCVGIMQELTASGTSHRGGNAPGSIPSPFPRQ